MHKHQTLSARQIKEETVKTLAEKIARAKTLIFADYHGLTVNQISDLRRKIKAAGGELVVTKNTLLARALPNYLTTQLPNSITGPTASIFSYEDEVAPTKAVADVAKTLGVPKFKFGFFGRDLLDTAAVESLAKIPPRPELHAKVVGALASPLYGIVGVLQANIRNLLSILDQISGKDQNAKV